MRALNDFEKEILRKIIRDRDINSVTCFANIMDSQLEDIDIYLDHANKNVEIRADRQLYNQGTLLDIVREISLEIIITVNLLKYLQENGYIAMFHDAPNTESRFGQL